MNYQDATRNELREELKERDLPVSGNKDELIERLEEADREDDGGDEDATRDELREELKERDLPVSGNKDELIERLEEADRDDADGENGDASEDAEDAAADEDAAAEDDTGDADERGGSSSKKLKPMQLARLAGAQLMQLTGRDLDGSAGIEQTDEGWCVLFEVVEVARVPRAMDVIGLYEVVVDDDGDLVRYERVRRYGRSQLEDRA